MLKCIVSVIISQFEVEFENKEYDVNPPLLSIRNEPPKVIIKLTPITEKSVSK